MQYVMKSRKNNIKAAHENHIYGMFDTVLEPLFK